jgi:hypothetical protein
MSKKYNRKAKNLSGLVVAKPSQVFVKDKVKKGVKIYARIDTRIPYLTQYHSKTKKNSYLGSYDKDVNIKNKKEIVDLLVYQ